MKSGIFSDWVKGDFLSRSEYFEVGYRGIFLTRNIPVASPRDNFFFFFEI